MFGFRAIADSKVLNRLRPEAVFALLALTAGLCMVFVNAPFQTPDEGSHFWRAYHVYEGNFLSIKNNEREITGGWIPKSVAEAHQSFEYLVGHPENRVEKEKIGKGLNEPFNNEDRIFMSMAFAALYSPVVYIPQALGIAVSRALDLSALWAMYFGRIANLLFWITGICIAIRIIPTFKWVFVSVALLPMNLFLAASLSADAPADCYASLLFALVFHSLWKENPLGRIHIFSITLLCVLLAFVKLPYVPLTGLVLLIPASRFGGLRNKVLFCVTSIGLAFITTMLWSSVVKSIYSPLHGANAPQQMALLMEHPWTFPELAIRSFKVHFFGIATSFIGKFGFLDTQLPIWIYYTYPFALITVALFDSEKGGVLLAIQRSWIALICLGSWALIMLSMFLTWTPPGENEIEGVQGRYFLPIAVPVFLMLFYNQKLKVSNKSLLSLIITLYLFVVSVVTCWTVYNRYFEPVS